ncbi:DUF2070 family protein [Candidatus Parcubacteria bacterium]|nr:DUF2070 family protein [Patescibacteria group bacterium]MBU4476958.1 DUF2070 family protein [Patescibacteria group bacterium]MCG2699301.1 DUF2070 family protein [Candidatus Parcubacteria bacterium]
MEKKINRFIYWTPRILSIAFILFLSLFAFDVFEEYSGWQVILGFLIHLLPSFILLAVILIAWKYDLVGAIAFLGSAVFYVFMVGFDRPWSWYIGISGPAAVVGILFFLSWLQKRKNEA